LPVDAPAGTDVTMLVALHVVTVADVPLNLTVPCVAPKFVPPIVTAAPTAPDVVETVVTVGVGSTVKLLPLVSTPLACTTTLPVVAPVGTEVTMLVALHEPTVAAVPLKLIVPCVVPKFDPEIVTDAPTAPDVADRLVMLGVGSTVKLLPLLSTPLACTTTLPVVAPVGTGATMLVALHVVTAAAVPLNLTVPCVVLKFEPAIVTDAPTAPVEGVRVVIAGVGSTVKLLPLLSTPLACSTTLPVVAPAGTVVTMLVALQVVTVAVVPLNLTVPVLPCVAPKFAPVIVTDAATAPDVTDRLVMLGAATTVKLFPLLLTPDTVTTTFPVVAPVGTVATMLVEVQLVVDAAVPLNLTVPVEPKAVPVIVTVAPTAPDVGDRLEIVGAATAAAGSPSANNASANNRNDNRLVNTAAPFISNCQSFGGARAKLDNHRGMTTRPQLQRLVAYCFSSSKLAGHVHSVSLRTSNGACRAGTWTDSERRCGWAG
jgi:hypothetical protein